MILKSLMAAIIVLGCQTLGFSRTLNVFESKNCQACDEMKPVLKKLERKGYKIVHIDVESVKGKALAKRYHVTHTPTFITVDAHGREQGREVGVVSEGVLLALLRVARFLVYGALRLIL